MVEETGCEDWCEKSFSDAFLASVSGYLETKSDGGHILGSDDAVTGELEALRRPAECRFSSILTCRVCVAIPFPLSDLDGSGGPDSALADMLIFFFFVVLRLVIQSLIRLIISLSLKPVAFGVAMARGSSASE